MRIAPSTRKTIVVLGGSGFIGRALVRSSVAAGHEVLAVARSEAACRVVEELGAVAVRGDASAPSGWVGAVAGADALVDLVQPGLPRRLTRRAVGRLATVRVANTRQLLAALATLPASDRPLLLSVSGTDDLLPDTGGRLSSASPPRSHPRGFARIGLPVRAAVDDAGLQAVHVYFGNVVYGPGKVFADLVVDGIRCGRARIVGRGDNRLPLVHVEDAAAALVHVIGLDPAETVGRTVVAVPPEPATQHDLFAITAATLGRPVPPHAPAPVASLVAGAVGVETITLDAACDPDLLLETGFAFRYEQLEPGIRASVAELERR